MAKAQRTKSSMPKGLPARSEGPVGYVVSDHFLKFHSFLSLIVSFLSDEMVAAPWEKPDQRRIIVEAEEIKRNDNEDASNANQDETEEEEQWCGAPECDQR